MDSGHRMSVHVRVCDVDQYALFLAAGSVYLLSGVPESGYSLGLEPEAANRYRSRCSLFFLRFGRETPILGRSVSWLNSAQGLDLKNCTGESQ